jgi:hypothetical protein
MSKIEVHPLLRSETGIRIELKNISEQLKKAGTRLPRSKKKYLCSRLEELMSKVERIDELRGLSF